MKVKAGAIYCSQRILHICWRNLICYLGVQRFDSWRHESSCFGDSLQCWQLQKTPVWSNWFDAKFKEKIHACKAHNTYFPQYICYTQSLYTSLNGDAYTTTQAHQTLQAASPKNIGIYHQAKEHPFLLRNEHTARWRFLLMHIIKRGLIYYLRCLRYSPFSVDNKAVDTSDGQK